MNEPESSESLRLTALTALVRGAAKPPTGVELAQGLATLRARLAGEEGHRRVAFGKYWLVAAVLSCVLLGLVLAPRLFGRANVTEPPVLVTRIEGGRILEGGYLSEEGHAGVQLYFNEGSRFVLAPGTRGRLRAVTAEGARLALDHGTASFQITRNLQRRWWVEAGPFSVSVRGTDFTVVWDPTREELEVKLRQGRVAVSGPVVGQELILQPGQSLSVSLPRGETVITDGRSGRAPSPLVSQGPAAADASVPSVPAPSATPTASFKQGSASPAAESEHTWREALANGQWDRILADAEREGVQTSLRTLSSDELFALADAARYRRRPELARSALLAQRERFPSSPRASDAIFLLGRVEESRAAKGAAITRYDEYLSRAPAGTYAAEALGRKMILVKEVEGPERAQHVAQEYLQRFPKGSYAEAARTMARAP